MSAEAEALYRKARFCLATGIAPSEYDALTDAEVAAFTEVHNTNQEKSNRG